MAPLLAWQAPAECPDAALVQARLGAALASLPNGWDQESEVRGRIAAGAGAEWVLELEIAPPAGTRGTPRRRRLTALHCDELADAAAVAIALALGDTSADRLAVREPAAPAAGVLPVALAVGVTGQEGRTDAAPQDETRALAAEVPALRREPRSSLGVAAGAVADSGLLAGLGWGATLGVQARFDRWGLGLYGVWLPEQSHSLAPGQGVNFGLLTAGLRGCYRALDDALGLDGCLGFELGSLSATTHGLAQAEDSRAALWAPLAGAALSWRAFEHWAFVARLDGLIALPQQQYMVNIDQPVHETPPFALRLSLGVEGELVRR
jgi:hypothetical protein